MKPCMVLAGFLAWFCALVFALPAGAQEGFSRAENRNGVWWIIDPQGAPTISAGVDNISYESDRIKATGECPYCDDAPEDLS